MSKKQDKFGIVEAANQLSNLNNAAQQMFGDIDKTIASTGRIKLNNLKDLKVPGTTWPQIQQQIADGKVCARRSSWPVGDMMWYKLPNHKYRNKETTEGVFYWPVSLQYLEKNKWNQLHIQGHHNRLRCTTKTIQVGFYPGTADRESNDWEIVEP